MTRAAPPAGDIDQPSLRTCDGATAAGAKASEVGYPQAAFQSARTTTNVTSSSCGARP
jgi:hypothetical protein